MHFVRATFPASPNLDDDAFSLMGDLIRVRVIARPPSLLHYSFLVHAHLPVPFTVPKNVSRLCDNDCVW